MDQAAFDALYERSYHRVVAQVYLTCGNLAEAQDCAQEAFIRAWDKRRQLDRDGHPEAWVRTVAHRISISRWRRDRRQLPLGEQGPEPAVSDPDAADRVALHRALQELPVETRRVIILHHLQDLSVNDIAAELGVPAGTVKARLSRGRARLAELLRVDAVDAGAVPALTSLMQESTMPSSSEHVPGDDPYGLERLAAPALAVPRPPVVEIRRRGGVRRRHRALAVGAGSVAAAVLVAGVAIAASGQVRDGAPWQLPVPSPAPSSAGPPPVAGSPGTSGTPGTPEAPLPQPGWDNVPTTEEIWSAEPGDLTLTDEQTGWSPQVAPSMCTVDTDALGATTVLQRHFGMPGTDAPVRSVYVMGFASVQDATQARDLLTDWYGTCTARLEANGAVKTGSTTGTPLQLAGTNVPADTTAFFHTVAWVQPEQQQAETGNWENATVTQVGNRLAWLVTSIRDAQDNNCIPGTDGPEVQCAVAREVPAVARRLE